MGNTRDFLPHAPEVEKDVVGLATQQLAPYGMTIARLGNFNISLDPQDEVQLEVPRPRHRILPPRRLLPAICGGQDAARCRDGHVKRWRKPKRRLSSSGPRRREPDQPATKHRAHPSSGAGICWRRFLPASATSAGI